MLEKSYQDLGDIPNVIKILKKIGPFHIHGMYLGRVYMRLKNILSNNFDFSGIHHHSYNLLHHNNYFRANTHLRVADRCSYFGGNNPHGYSSVHSSSHRGAVQIYFKT